MNIYTNRVLIMLAAAPSRMRTPSSSPYTSSGAVIFKNTKVLKNMNFQSENDVSGLMNVNSNNHANSILKLPKLRISSPFRAIIGELGINSVRIRF